MKMTQPMDMTEEEYAERAKMVQDVKYGQAKPDSMDHWHGKSACGG
jgi:hypothetical protein